MNTYPALDFLRKVDVWQHAPGGTAGLAVVLPEGDETTLAQLLAKVSRSGPTTLLEAQARYWLVGYRETNPPLTTAQASELDEVIRGSVAASAPIPAGRRFPSLRRLALVIGMLLIVVAAGLGISHLLIGNGNGSPPPAGPAAAQQAGPQPGALTDLQRFRADWNIPASASADAGERIQLVLLQDGLYYPAPWGLLDGGTGWEASTPASIASVRVDPASQEAAVTDSDGTTYTVITGQPFVLASDPAVIFRVLRDGTIQSMPGSHAITIRHRL